MQWEPVPLLGLCLRPWEALDPSQPASFCLVPSSPCGPRPPSEPASAGEQVDSGLLTARET